MANYFNKDIRPVEYKRWLWFIRYLKEKDLYLTFIQKTMAFVTNIPNFQKEKHPTLFFMNQFSALNVTFWFAEETNKLRFNEVYVKSELRKIIH